LTDRKTPRAAPRASQVQGGQADRGHPESISILKEHMDTYVREEPGALMFPAAKGGPMRRSRFNTRTHWVDVVKDMGLSDQHFHDLRHTGNMLAVMSGGRSQGLDGADGARQRESGHDLSARSQRR
jgi:integrase